MYLNHTILKKFVRRTKNELLRKRRIMFLTAQENSLLRTLSILDAQLQDNI